jgi:hypothetical protein
MKTYKFTAFRTTSVAANGEVKADSPEEAKAKILSRYHQGDLIFGEYVDGEEPDHIMLTDEAGEECHLEDETPPDVLKALKALIEKADDLIAAIYGVTDQFGHEVSALRDAASTAEKAIQAAGGAS